MARFLSRLGSALDELRRRRIVRVAVVYCIVAFTVAEAADAFLPPLGLEWAVTLVVVLCLLGLPIALVLAWAFDLTPEGVRPGAAPEDGAAEGQRTARWLVVGLAVLLTGAGAWFARGVWQSPEPEPAVAAEEPFPPSRLAVLQLDDHSREPTRGLASGLTEALTHELAQVEELDVAPRAAGWAYREGEIGLDSLVRQYRLGTLVEGSVQTSGDTVRVTAQLIDARARTHLASVTVQRPATDLFALQDDLVREVSSTLRRELGIELQVRRQRRETADVDAWLLLHRGTEMMSAAEQLRAEGDTAAAGRELARADELLSRASRLDPGWIEPVVRRGHLAIRQAWLRSPERTAYDRAWLERARGLADSALVRAPGDPRALELRGMARLRLAQLAEGDRALRTAAEKDLRTALDAEPDRARAWSELSDLLRQEGRFAEASLAAERALEADAFLQLEDVVIYSLYTATLELADTAAARRWCAEGHRRFPERDWFHGCRLYNLALFEPPDVETAWRLLDTLVAHSADPDVTKNRAQGRLWVAAVLARRAAELSAEDDSATEAAVAALRDSARTVIADARDLAGPSPTLTAWLDFYEAYVRHLLGEDDRALDLLGAWLEAMPQDRSRLSEDWMFRDLWDDQRFRGLVERGPALRG